MAKNKDDWALVIGIGTYPQLPPLRGAHKDANDFAEWLRKPEGGGLPKEQVFLVLGPEQFPLSRFDASPVKRQIDEALSKIGLENNQKIGRRFYFYFSGHGIGHGFDDVAMLMADATERHLNNNIGLRLYLSLFHDIAPFDEVVFVLDCCRDVVGQYVASPPAFTPAIQGAPAQVEDFVLLAARNGQKAFEAPDDSTRERRGLLTRAILEGLKDPAGADPDGRITALSLRRYVLKRVSELAAQNKLNQQADIRRVPNVDMVFGTVA